MKECDLSPEILFAKGAPKVSKDKRIVFKDTKGGQSTYIALNSSCKKVCKISIDGYLINHERKKCDFGLWVENNNKLFLIELKGRRVEDAIEQLYATHRFFCANYRDENFNYSFRIVASRINAPNLKTKINQERKRGKDIKIFSQKGEENI